MFFFLYMEMLRIWHSACVFIRDCSYRFRACIVCVSFECVCVCVSLRGMTGERGVNLNAGHCAACRFRFCLSALFCAQDGNPSNMARIPIKSNSPPPATIEDRQLRGDRWRIQRTWQVTLQSASSHTLMCFSRFGLRLFCPFAWGQN